MQVFKSQVAMTDFAYERAEGDKELMVSMVATFLAENPSLIKEHKRNQLDEGGTKAYRAYAKVKVREYFKRHVAKKSQTIVVEKPKPKAKAAFEVQSEWAAGGTSLSGHITANYQDLVKCFGEPLPGDDYKVSGEWNFKDQKGNAFTIYDWKSTVLYDHSLPRVEEFRNQPQAEFNIGSKVDATEFIRWVKATLNTSHLHIS